MKKQTLAVLVLILSIFFGCTTTVSETEVGSKNDTVIPGMSIVVDSTYIQGTSMYARGRVFNNGTAAASTPWYVEAQFYTDVTFTTKLGGNNTVINFPLNPGQNTFWTITFSSQNVDVRQFPNFRVSDLRAVYKN